MQTSLEVDIQIDDKDFFAALEDPQGFMPVLADSMESILEVYKNVAWDYAPESEANRPGRTDEYGMPQGFYERGRGWWYPVITHNTLALEKELPVVGPHSKGPKTLRALALIARNLNAVGYKLIESSEQMHDRWMTEVSQENNDVIGTLSNSASYSNYVQGMDRIDLHKRRGWQDVKESFENPDVQNAVMSETLNAIDTYYHLKA